MFFLIINIYIIIMLPSSSMVLKRSFGPRKGLIHFEGELLLQGQHDSVEISILAPGAVPPALSKPPAQRQGSKESTKSEEKFKVDTSQRRRIQNDYCKMIKDEG